MEYEIQRVKREILYDGGNILIGLFLGIAIISIPKYFRQHRQFVKLIKIINNIQVDVMRNGRRQQVSIFDIVVGDVVCLKIGDQVPADGMYIDGHSLLVDESIMTMKSEHNPSLSVGTKVVDGFGRMLVTSVGMNTTWGEVMGKISIDSNEQTLPKFQLNKLTSSIGKVSLDVVNLVPVILLIVYLTRKSKDKNGSKTKADYILDTSVGIVAAIVPILCDAIPGGLPVVVTLALFKSTKQMMSDLSLSGKRSACETMGFVTTICIDKTGTLTLNQMKVKKFWIGHKSIEESGTSSVATTVVELLHQAIGFNTTGSVTMSASGSEFEFCGSPTEKAILSWIVSEQNFDMEGLQQSCENLHVEPFNSMNKTSGVLTRKSGQNTFNLHIQGEAKVVLAMCSNYYDDSGTIRVLGEVERKRFQGTIDGMEAGGLRCNAFAHKQVQIKEGKPQIEENCLNLLGLVGLTDPCLGLKVAVQKLQSKGVNVKMITSYDISTATKFAIKCGILEPEGPDQDMESGEVEEGEKFRNYTPEVRMEKVNKIRVMAVSSPNDKVLMIQSLKLTGHIVGVIGDGTNDVLALKEADIPISMGEQMSEVAKECSDIIILDDDFVSVATIFRRGRWVFRNVKKFFQLQLTGIVVGLVINFVALVSKGTPMISVVQLFWVNLIINILVASTFATENPTKELMVTKPVGRKKQLRTNFMWMINLLPQACYQIAVLLALLFKGEAIFNVSASVNGTLIFNVFVLCLVFYAFALWAPKKKNVFEEIYKTKKLFLFMIGVVIVLQWVMVQFLKFMDTERLNWWQWGICVGLGFVSWLIEWAHWAVKWIACVSSTPSELDPSSTAKSGKEVANSSGKSGDELYCPSTLESI